MAPDSSTSVVVLCNRDDAEVYDLALEVLDVVAHPAVTPDTRHR